jgi:hypothetical protein
MSQMSFGDAEYAGKRKRTRREEFLGEMEKVAPSSALESLIEPHYPKAGGGRRPYPLATMLRIHLMLNWFGFSDQAMEEALHEITPLRLKHSSDQNPSGKADDLDVLVRTDTHARVPCAAVIQLQPSKIVRKRLSTVTASGRPHETCSTSPVKLLLFRPGTYPG